eukprot:2085177-Pyramimonas_sp.AAC.1
MTKTKTSIESVDDEDENNDDGDDLQRSLKIFRGLQTPLEAKPAQQQQQQQQQTIILPERSVFSPVP